MSLAARYRLARGYLRVLPAARFAWRLREPRPKTTKGQQP